MAQDPEEQLLLTDFELAKNEMEREDLQNHLEVVYRAASGTVSMAGIAEVVYHLPIPLARRIIARMKDRLAEDIRLLMMEQ